MHENNVFPFFVICFCFFLGGLLLGFQVGNFATHEFKKEAVKNKAAHWVIVDEDGNTKFEWNTTVEK